MPCTPLHQCILPHITSCGTEGTESESVWQSDYVRKWVLAKIRTFWPNPGDEMRPTVVKKGFIQTCRVSEVVACLAVFHVRHIALRITGYGCSVQDWRGSMASNINYLPVHKCHKHL